MSKIVSAALKAKATDLEAKAEVKAIKAMWPWGTSRPTPDLEDYTAASCTWAASNVDVAFI